jgi:acetyl-CoA carboxylase biotin carboxylase subunit
MRVAEGPLAPRGWAIECRITSEDPASGFLPTTGHVEYLHAPGGPGVRWDAGVESGSDVTLFYDSMLAKLIVWARDRDAAIGRMQRALEELVLVGVSTTQPFHRRLMADPEFRRGDVDIQFLERRPDLSAPEADAALVERIAVAAALAEAGARGLRTPATAGEDRAGREWARVARREGLR